MSRIHIFTMAGVMVALLCQDALAESQSPTYNTRPFPWPKESMSESCYRITSVASETEYISDLLYPEGWNVAPFKENRIIYAHHCGTTLQYKHFEGKTYCFSWSGEGKGILVMETKNKERYLEKVECPKP